MHADFSRHPARHDWVRELNLLLYLNEPYDEAWGGHLELQHLGTESRARIAPVGNRLVIMLTKAHTLHGYRPISFPAGRYRTSLASYAYTEDRDFQRTPLRSTAWRRASGNAHEPLSLPPIELMVLRCFGGIEPARWERSGKAVKVEPVSRKRGR